jgi:hypothetical protein
MADRRDDADRRVAVEAAYEWHQAKHRVRKPDPVAAVEETLKLALGSLKSEPLRAELRRIAKRELAKANASRDRIARRLAKATHAGMRPPVALDDIIAKATQLARMLPTPQRWKEFHQGQVVPAFNRLEGPLRRCLDCGEPFVPRDRRQVFCSSGCSARSRNRGRGTTKALIHRHVRRCERCRDGRPCGTLDRLANLPAADRLPGVTHRKAPTQRAGQGDKGD